MTDYTDPVASGTFTDNDSYVMKLGGAHRNVPFNTIYVWGTFDGGTVTVEISPDGTNWFPVNAGLDAKGFLNMQGRFITARIKMAGASSPNASWVVI